MATSNRRLELQQFDKLGFTEETIPTPAEDGLVVETRYAGVCHTDVHFARGFNVRKDFKLPRVLGHENSGVIHSLGPETAKKFPDLRVGDRVALYPWGACMKCDNCTKGVTGCPYFDVPESLPGEARRNYRLGINVDGGFQNFIAVAFPETVIKVPDNVSLGVAALAMCSGVTAYSAVSQMKDSIELALRTTGHATVALFGMGGLALWGIQIIKALYPANVKVVAVDVLQEKLEDGKSAGADSIHCWSRDASLDDASRDLIAACGGRPDAGVDFTGYQTVIERALQSLNLHGTLVVVGLGGLKLPTNPSLGIFVRRGISLRGNMTGSKEQTKETLELVRQGKVKPPPIEYITLDDVEKTIDLVHQGTQRGRAVVKF